MVTRGKAGEERSASCISAPSVNIPQSGKTILLSTFVPTLERNHSAVLFVHMALLLRITLNYTFEPIQEKNLLTVLTVHSVQPGRTAYKFTFVYTQARSPTHVQNAPTVPLRRMLWCVIC